MPGRNTSPSPTPTASTTSAPHRRSAPSVTRFDNAMAESVIGLFKTELHRNPAALAANGGHWRGLDDLEIATCGWVVVVQRRALPRRARRPHPSRVRSRLLPSPLSARPRHEKPTQRAHVQTQSDSRCAHAGSGPWRSRVTRSAAGEVYERSVAEADRADDERTPGPRWAHASAGLPVFGWIGCIAITVEVLRRWRHRRAART